MQDGDFWCGVVLSALHDDFGNLSWPRKRSEIIDNVSSRLLVRREFVEERIDGAIAKLKAKRSIVYFRGSGWQVKNYTERSLVQREKERRLSGRGE